eukprot:4926179-Pyramimonas_sp.AAC.1
MTRKKTRTIGEEAGRGGRREEDGKTRTGERRRGKQEHKVVDAPHLRTTTMGRACDVKTACCGSVRKGSRSLYLRKHIKLKLS